MAAGRLIAFIAGRLTASTVCDYEIRGNQVIVKQVDLALTLHPDGTLTSKAGAFSKVS